MLLRRRHDTDAVSAAGSLALEEARRGIDSQMAELSGLRARAAALVGVASVAGSVGSFAAHGAAGSGCTGRVLEWLTVAAFVALTICVGCVLWPRVFTNALDAATVLKWSEGEGHGAQTVLVNLTEAHAQNRAANARVLAMMNAYYTWALLFVAAEVLLILIRSVIV